MNGVGGSSLVGLTSSTSAGNTITINAINASGIEAMSTATNTNTLNGVSVMANIMSDDDDEDMISSPGSFVDDEDGSYIGADDVTAQLAAAGPVGLAAAAAIASAKRRKRHHCFELNPSIRKRQQTRLLKKLKTTIDEFATRVGQQAVVVVATPSKTGNNFKCFGAKPLEDVMKSLRQMVLSELESALALQAPPPPMDDPSLHELPPLVIDGIPTPVEKMTQAQLRAFIPLMLKYSTGRGKPGWGKDCTRPPWWPKDVPWANVRMDARSEDMKQKVSWTTALRQIVLSCYKYHRREDLLPTFTEEDEKSQTQINQNHGNQNTVFAGSVVQTISNADGTVSLIQVDPSNPVIHLPDGTTAHVQGMAQLTSSNHNSSDDDQPVAIDINQVGDSSLPSEGTIIFTSEDGSQIPVNVSGSYGPVSGMITLPLPVYQTVVANIQGADGQQHLQHLQVVTPLVQVPKMEPGLENVVDVTGSLSSSIDASHLIRSQHHHHRDEEDTGDSGDHLDMGDGKSD